MRSATIYCNGVKTPAKLPEDAVVLDLRASPAPSKKVSLRLEHITRAMLAEVPDRLADLVEIATYIYCADQFVRRDSLTMPRLGEQWRRSLSFHIAVRDLAFWNHASIQKKLVSALEFLSDEQFQFEFTPIIESGPRQNFLELSGDGSPAAFVPDEVILFSGGLDSFAGAVEAVLKRQSNVALVSHQASPMLRKIQANLVGELQRRGQASRVLHVGVTITKGIAEAVEFTQRTRSFLFAVLGFAVGHMLGCRRISFYENGVVSLNLPLATHVLGSRATRTTHPRVLCAFSDLFSMITSSDLVVSNPFFWKTKSDVIQIIKNSGCSQLIRETFSCASVRKATWLRGLHCGVCSQCLDRRFGILAAGCAAFEDATRYDVDLFRGERKPGIDTAMAESYVLAAHRYATVSETAFVGSHGELFYAFPYLNLPPAEAVSRVYQMHRRHGEDVVRVVNEQYQSLNIVADLLGLPDSSLLAMIQGPLSEDVELRDPAETKSMSGSPTRGEKTVERPICFAVDRANQRVVFTGGITLEKANFKIVAALLADYLAGPQGVVGEVGYVYQRASNLAISLRMTEATLRQQITRLRQVTSAAFKERLGVTIAADDIVQNERWKGYRLNPYLNHSLSLLQSTIEAAQAAQ